MTKISKKLQLNRETLVALQRDELGAIRGGAGEAGCHSNGCPDLTTTRGTIGTIGTIGTLTGRPNTIGTITRTTMPSPQPRTTSIYR
ncbi:MAG: class I lanthipeptide [Kofleriaceae bacterium]